LLVAHQISVNHPLGGKKGLVSSLLSLTASLIRACACSVRQFSADFSDTDEIITYRYTICGV
jgi:hypothetical protein